MEEKVKQIKRIIGRLKTKCPSIMKDKTKYSRKKKYKEGYTSGK